MRLGSEPLRDEEGNLESCNQKMSELLNEQYICVLSTKDPSKTINYPKDFFGHQQATTLSGIDKLREDIIDAIKTISQNSSGVMTNLHH